MAVSLNQMSNLKRNTSLLAFFVDFILLNISFFVLNYFKRGNFKLSPAYIKLLIAFYIIWIFVSLFTKKFRVDTCKSYFRWLLLYTKSIIFIAYSISFMVVIMGLAAFSRLYIFGTCVMLLILEILLFTIYYVSIGKNRVDQLKEIDRKALFKPKISIFLLVSNFLLISFAFYIMNFYKSGTFRLSPEYEKILFVIYGLWLVVSIITRKFDKHNFQNYYYGMAACIKSFILMGAVMSVVIFAFRFSYFSRLQIFGTFLFLISFEAIIYYIYFILKSERNVDGDVESFEKMHEFLEQKKLTIEKKKKKGKASYSPSFMKILMDKCLKSYPHLFEFLSNTIDLSKFEDSEILIMGSPYFFNIKILKNHSFKLLINFHRLNDIRWINRYFLELYKKLVNGTYFVGRADTIETHKKRFFKKYGKYYTEVFYILNFIFSRVFPKLPKIKKIYFALTKGKKRIISKAEVLGRLYFCGFKVLAEQEIDGCLFFIAQKAKTASLDQSPSYGSLIKLKRIGLNGKIIYIHKFRTMYPYSEYLQEYIYRHQKLKEGGKIKDDFRITEWGKFMRKYWLDELPMIYNWIKGDVKLFGVRPLSMHYFSLYESHLREMRIRIKPGLIPPFYADLPGKFKEIIESEKRYIQEYCKHPLKTQCIYLWKALNNIIIKGARSG